MFPKYDRRETIRHNAIKRLTEVKRDLDEGHIDPEEAHAKADYILTDVLKELGFEDMANVWHAIEPKWYS